MKERTGAKEELEGQLGIASAITMNSFGPDDDDIWSPLRQCFRHGRLLRERRRRRKREKAAAGYLLVGLEGVPNETDGGSMESLYSEI